ncbi:MAG: hypothetical protein Q7S26_04235 [bacterium]|nr:hypothetical protein [bacterium]
MALVIKRRFVARAPLFLLSIPNTLWVVALIVGAGVVFAFGVSAFVGSLQHPSQNDSSIFESLYKAGSAQAYATPVSGTLSPSQVLEMHVANNGSIYIKGAVVTAVSGGAVVASVTWGSATFPWRIQSSYLTSVAQHDGKKIALADLAVGDRIIITGTINSNATEPTIDAQSIRKN